MNIKRIAELAGVSVATVSRVFNHPERVHPETRERVLAITEKYQFTPNWFARSLNLETSNTIALLIPGIETDFYQQIISGIEMVAGSKGFAVIFCQTRDQAEHEFGFLEMMINRKVDGIIQVNSHLDADKAPVLQKLDIPRVHIGKNRGCGCDSLCYIDIEEGSFRLTQHLIRLGHKRVMILFDEMQGEESVQIDTGFRRAVQYTSKPIVFIPEQGENSVQGGYMALQRMIQKNELPDVLVTSSDLQAIGAMKAAHDARLAIPNELALASLTDSAVCSVLSPALTCVELPSKKLGMAAARMLLDQIEGDFPYMDMPHDMILQPKLRIRESCGNKQQIYETFD